jgi:hypothetical protein
VTALLVALWPLTFVYSSVGVDVEHLRSGQLETRMWRVRWPGDGSVQVGWIDQHHPAAPGTSSSPMDPAALVLQRPRPMTPHTAANRWGFWWTHVDASRGDPPSDAAPHADRVMLAGAPHWLLVLAATLVAAWTSRRDLLQRLGSGARRDTVG